MLTQGAVVEVHALARRGWSVSAIARHLDRDRKTVHGYLQGTRQPGVRAGAAPDPLRPFAAYVSARFADNPHIWPSALFDEVVPLGYHLSYVSFARQLRLAGLRRGNGRGAVESWVRCGWGGWWRTMTATTPAQAQTSLDAFCSGTADARRRKAGGIASTVGALADAEPLVALPAAAYPATVIV